MKQKREIVVSKSDLQQIYHEALQEFKNTNSVELSNIEFVAASNLKAVASFLSRNGLQISFDIEYTKRSKLQK